MRGLWALAFVLLATPAQACVVAAGFELRDIFQADAVVDAIVVDYEIVPGPRPGPLDDYARITLFVRKVLAGDVPARRLVVTWDNSTFGEPDDLQGRQLLIALHRAGSPGLPLRSGSGVILHQPEPELMSVLQAPCAPAFVFDFNSDTARAIRMILDDKGDAEAEVRVLSEFLGLGPIR